MKGMVREVGQEGSERAEQETFLVVQGLTLHAPNAGAPGSIPGQGTRSHMPHPRVHMPQLRTSEK